MKRHSRTCKTHHHTLTRMKMNMEVWIHPCTIWSVQGSSCWSGVITIYDLTHGRASVFISRAYYHTDSTGRGCELLEDHSSNQPQSPGLELLLVHDEKNSSNSKHKDKHLTVLLCPFHLLPLTHQWYCCHPCKVGTVRSVFECSQEHLENHRRLGSCSCFFKN